MWNPRKECIMRQGFTLIELMIVVVAG
ncbi:hypothetical protein B7993_02090 [Fibrobacter sp. UWH3]|nr:hypothetical protein B7993_02090 [Fibrobacter sp. UWH3]OWV17424.1 hypothetical protein B7992_00730 [Fibrobacter sp. UWH1]